MIDKKYLVQFGFETLVDLLEISKNDSDFNDIKEDIQAIDNAIRSQDKDIMISLNKYLSEKYSLRLDFTKVGLEIVPGDTLINMSLEYNMDILVRIRWVINKTGSKSLLQKLLEATAKAGIKTAINYTEDKLIEGIMGEDTSVIDNVKKLDDNVYKAQKMI